MTLVHYDINRDPRIDVVEPTIFLDLFAAQDKVEFGDERLKHKVFMELFLRISCCFGDNFRNFIRRGNNGTSSSPSLQRRILFILWPGLDRDNRCTCIGIVKCGHFLNDVKLTRLDSNI